MQSVRSQIIEGIIEGATIIASTLGPCGKAVAFRKVPNSQVVNGRRMSKDGVTVASYLKDRLYTDEQPWHKMGLDLLLEAADATVRKEGDGTTTTSIILKTLVENINPSVTKNQLDKLGIDKDRMIQAIKDMAIDPTEEQVIDIAIRAAKDEDLGKKIGKLAWDVGAHGVIMGGHSKGVETETELKSGYFIETGALAPQFLGNQPFIRLENPYVMVFEGNIEEWKGLERVLRSYQEVAYDKASNTYTRPLLILVRSVSETVLSFVLRNLFENKGGANVPVCLVKSPHDHDTLNDIVKVSGSRKLFDSITSHLKSFNGHADFGEFEAVVVEKNQTHFLFDDKAKVRAENLAEKIEALEKTPANIERISKLKYGIGFIYPGGYTDSEIMRVNDAVEDAARSCQSAIKNGIVPGAGLGLYKTKPEDELLRRVSCSVAYQLMASIGTEEFFYSENDEPFNVDTMERDNTIYVSAGILISALNHAFSVAAEVTQVDYGA